MLTVCLALNGKRPSWWICLSLALELLWDTACLVRQNVERRTGRKCQKFSMTGRPTDRQTQILTPCCMNAQNREPGECVCLGFAKTLSGRVLFHTTQTEDGVAAVLILSTVLDCREFREMVLVSTHLQC